ncbi:MAG: SAM-dependent methyltransferase [Burkholderiales bacterium]|nr:SAM-dependent methyltransferase [Burkholderiales bacterium]
MNKNFELAKFEQVVNNATVILELAKSEPNTRVLKQYKGFGGIGQCFQSEKLTGMVLASIRQVFGEHREAEILASIKSTCKSAYYTPPEIIQFIYSYLANVCNFRGGDILEPSCGIGAFIEHMPEDIKQNSKITAIEMDIVTSEILSGIYQGIGVINKPLQEVDFAETKFDLIIGNPPYSSEVVNDIAMPDISTNYSIHHYFLAKCIRLLKDDGLLAFVMPSFCMDIPSKHVRDIVDKEAVLIDAIRLPDNLFSNAKVTVDILFFRKTGNKKHEFVETVQIQQDQAKEHINKFWLTHQNRVLGKHVLKWVEAYKRYLPCCTSENSSKVLEYLKTCTFDEKTKNNFSEIIRKDEPTRINNFIMRINELKQASIMMLPQLIDEIVADLRLL